jgi:hypothetical protein
MSSWQWPRAEVHDEDHHLQEGTKGDRGRRHRPDSTNGPSRCQLQDLVTDWSRIRRDQLSATDIGRHSVTMKTVLTCANAINRHQASHPGLDS